MEWPVGFLHDKRNKERWVKGVQGSYLERWAKGVQGSCLERWVKGVQGSCLERWVKDVVEGSWVWKGIKADNGGGSMKRTIFYH